MQQERERQLAEAEAARTAKLAKRKAALRQLYGAEKASPGALFAGVELDAKDTPDNWVDRRAAWIETSGFRVSIGGSERNDRFRAITWNPLGEEREELCTALETGLGTSWGSAWVGDDGTLLWTNEITGVRASFQPSDCELRIERFDLPVKWLSKSGASTVPLSDEAERHDLHWRLQRLAHISPYLMILLLPGSILFLPLIARWLDRRCDRRAGRG